MRGPTNNTNTVEDTETEGSFEETIRNDNLSGHVICSRSVSTASSKKEEEDGTPIWKVGRMLMDSLSKGKMRRSKIFGAPLEDLPLNCQGMPKIAHRLCCYLEQYGLKEPDLFGVCKKQGKLVERYRISFDRAGDADLESCNDVKVIASLLKLWLHDLPHPLIPQRLIARLTTVFQKYERKEVYDLNAELCNVLLACPALNLGVLYTVVRLLYFYVTKWYPASYVDQLPEMFAKILIGDSMIEHVEIVTTLIHNFRDIFNERILERAFKLYLVREKKNRDGVDLTITGDCGNVSLSSVDKLIRSNSEEKLSIRSDHNRNLAMKNLNMRRVNSHEDFSGHLQHGYCKPVQVVIVDNQQNGASDADNMSRYQISRLYDPQYDEPVVDSFNRITYFAEKDAEVLVAPPPFNYNEDYKLQEEIRNTERFTPQFNMYRNVGRRKRGIYQGHSVKPKIKAVFEQNTSIPPYGGESKPNNFYDEISCNVDGFANESNRSPTESTFQDSDTHSISSTSSDSSSESSSPTRMNSSPEPAQYFNDISEPLTSYENWSFAHRHPHNSNIERSVSPKIPINLSHHSHDLSASSHAVHLSGIEMKILQVNKHLQWVKRKKKRFEEDFESKFGETASISNKMAHPEYKQMSASIIHLKNNLKQLRKEANESFSAHRLHITKNPNNSVNLGLFSSSPIDKEKAVQEAEKQLCEKRIATERPECVEDMTHEQLLDEKVSIQRELLHLESTFGQTAARNEDLFHHIYSRYRTVKRFLARSTASLKLKEASSDLATIIENETMDFDPANTIANMCEDKSTSAECQPLCNADGSDVRISNIHELSSPELMMEYKATKDEKKKLRNRIYMYEQEAENKTLNDSKYCIHTLRIRYKNTKAKLKLLEALLTKSK